MKNLFSATLSVLVLNTVFVPDALAHPNTLGTSTGPTNPSPRSPYLGGGV